MAPQKAPVQMYTLKEVASILRLTRRQVSYAIKARHLKAHNISLGSKRPTWRIRETDLNRFIMRRSR